MIEESEVFRRGRYESHVPSDLVQFPVALRLSGMRCFECMNLQPRPWVQCKVPALPSERPSEVKLKQRRGIKSYKVIYVDSVLRIAVCGREAQTPPC